MGRGWASDYRIRYPALWRCRLADRAAPDSVGLDGTVLRGLEGRFRSSAGANRSLGPGVSEGVQQLAHGTTTFGSHFRFVA